MAVQVTIKITKTDNREWFFESTENSELLQEIESQKGWVRDEWNTPSNNEAILIKTFANMIEANKFIIKNVDTNYSAYEAASAMVKQYTGWDEQITTKEI